MYSLTLAFAFCLVEFLLLAQSEDVAKLPNLIEEQIMRCRADDYEQWTYRGVNGPDSWAHMYEDCHGLRQSPIHIDSSRTYLDRTLYRLYFNYFWPIRNPVVRNDGHTIVVTPGDTNRRTVTVFGSPHNLREIHFHWGSKTGQGSEHVLDGVQYPMEIHLVHVNNYNHTAVVAIFCEETEEINAELQHIVNELPKVMYKDTEIQSPYRLDGMNLLPENPASYFLYLGSLTTPECTEDVTWIVLKSPIHVGRRQLTEFRKLFSSPQNMTEIGCKISDNFRPVQRLNRRTVYSSW